MLQVSNEGATVFGSICPRQRLSSIAISLPSESVFEPINIPMLLLLMMIQLFCSVLNTSCARILVFAFNETCSDCMYIGSLLAFNRLTSIERGTSWLHVSTAGSGSRASTLMDGALALRGTGSLGFLPKKLFILSFMGASGNGAKACLCRA